MHQTAYLMKGSTFFKLDLPLFVNRAMENFDTRFHYHDFVEITYVAEGQGFHHISDYTVAARQGDLFIVPEGVPHVFRPGSANSRQRLVVYNMILGKGLWERIHSYFDKDQGVWNELFGDRLRGEEQQPAYEGCLSLPGRWLMLRNQREVMNPLFEELHYEFQNKDRTRRALLLASVVRLLILVDRCLNGRDDEERGHITGQSGISDAIRYLRVHYREPLSLADMASRCGLSQRHFFRLFKRSTGQTYTQYLQSVRVEAACKLLQDQSLKVLAVAEAVGYRDMDSFYRVFKQRTGLTPGKYRHRKLTGTREDG